MLLCPRGSGRAGSRGKQLGAACSASSGTAPWKQSDTWVTQRPSSTRGGPKTLGIMGTGISALMRRCQTGSPQTTDVPNAGRRGCGVPRQEGPTPSQVLHLLQSSVLGSTSKILHLTDPDTDRALACVGYCTTADAPAPTSTATKPLECAQVQVRLCVQRRMLKNHHLPLGGSWRCEHRR